MSGPGVTLTASDASRKPAKAGPKGRKANAPPPPFVMPSPSCPSSWDARLRLHPGADRRCRIGVERPSRARREIEAVGKAEAQPLQPSPGDHRRVVGAEAQ